MRGSFSESSGRTFGKNRKPPPANRIHTDLYSLETTTATPRSTSIKKMILYFTYQSRGTLKSFTLFITVKTVTKLNLGHIDKFEIKNLKSELLWFTFSRQRRIWSFRIVVFQRTAKKCTKNYNARAQPLFSSLNPLLDCLFAAVAVVVCLSSLLCLEEAVLPVV